MMEQCPMQFNTAIYGTEYKVYLEGHSSHRDCQTVVEITKRFIESGCNTLVFDFKKLTLLDSLGVSIILLARKTLDGRQGKLLLLRHPLGKVRHMFKVFNIDKLVTVEW